MITICEECGKKYRIDAQKISGTEAKFKCKDCGHVITVSKPLFEIDDAQSDTPAPSRAPAPDDAGIEEKKTVAPQPAETKKSDTQKAQPAFGHPPKPRFGLTAKLFTMMIIVSLVPLSMFWGVSLKQTQERMRDDSKKYINQMSINISHHLEEWMDNNSRVLRTLVRVEDIISMDKQRQEPLLKIVPKVYPWIELTITIDTNGMRVAGNDSGSSTDYSKAKFFQEIMAGKLIAWQVVTQEPSKIPSLFLAIPILHYDEIVGVIANAIRLSDLSKFMRLWTNDDTITAFLTDANGNPIAQAGRDYMPQQKQPKNNPLVSAYLKGQRGMILSTNEAGKSVLGHVRGTTFGWNLAVQQEEKDAFYIVEQLLSYAYLLLGITVAFVFTIAWFSGRALSRPIIRLTDAADRISVGELDVQIDTRRKDEIGNLAEAIARMQDSIRLSIERLRQRRK
jgi:methyl-accepting chemotaxis protein